MKNFIHDGSTALETLSTVYFLDGEKRTTDDELTVVKKALLAQDSYRGRKIDFPLVMVLENVGTDEEQPSGDVKLVARDELLTAREIRDALQYDDGPLSMDGRPLDEIVADPRANGDLAYALGQVMTSQELISA
jgi:hypothetical protein